MSRTLEDRRYIALIASLKAARLARGMTQQELADSLDRPQSYIAKVEGLERRLDVLEYWDLCEALKVKRQ